MSARSATTGPGSAPRSSADHAGDRDLGAHLVEAERAQVGGDDAGGAHLAVAELGMGVQVAPPGDQLRLDGRDRGIDLGAESVGVIHGDGMGGHGVLLERSAIVSGRAAPPAPAAAQPCDSSHRPGWLGRAPWPGPSRAWRSAW